MNVIINFACPTTDCGWREEIGVDTKSGLVIKGDITMTWLGQQHEGSTIAVVVISAGIAISRSVFRGNGNIVHGNSALA